MAAGTERLQGNFLVLEFRVVSSAPRGHTLPHGGKISERLRAYPERLGSRRRSHARRRAGELSAEGRNCRGAGSATAVHGRPGKNRLTATRRRSRAGSAHFEGWLFHVVIAEQTDNVHGAFIDGEISSLPQRVDCVQRQNFHVRHRQEPGGVVETVGEPFIMGDKHLPMDALGVGPDFDVDSRALWYSRHEKLLTDKFARW